MSDVDYSKLKPEEFKVAVQKARSEGKLKPGQTIPGTQIWVEWKPEDLNSEETVDFVPQDVPTLHFPVRSVNGKPLIKVDVNGLGALYEVGTLTRTNKFFYNVYENVLEQNIKLEALKRGGPERVKFLWEWIYIPYAMSFAFDLEGRSLRRGDWYEMDPNGIPIAINNIKKLASLYYSGDISLNLTKLEVARFVFYLLKSNIKDYFKKLRRGKK